jgi:hypothetical protein
MNRKLMGNLAKVLAAAGWADKTLTSAEIEDLKDLLFQFQQSVIDPREDALFEMYIKSPVDAAERERLVESLTAALAEVCALREILPICSYCRKVRDDEDYWHTVEHYIARHTKTRFSHAICPSCMATEVEPQLGLLERG